MRLLKYSLTLPSHKIAIYRSESPIYFTVTRFLLTELYIRHVSSTCVNFHAPRAKRSGILWQVPLITFSDKSIWKTLFETLETRFQKN